MLDRALAVKRLDKQKMLDPTWRYDGRGRVRDAIEYFLRDRTTTVIYKPQVIRRQICFDVIDRHHHHHHHHHHQQQQQQQQQTTSAVMNIFNRTSALFFVLIALLAQLNHALGKFHKAQCGIMHSVNQKGSPRPKTFHDIFTHGEPM